MRKWLPWLLCLMMGLAGALPPIVPGRPADARELSSVDPLQVPGSIPAELFSLLRYLGIDYPTFQSQEPRYFAALQALLAQQGNAQAQSTLDRNNFRDVVASFQRGRSLPANGIPDEDTLWELQRGWARSRHLALVNVPADIWPGRPGQRSMPLRQDAAAAYNQLRGEVNALGGVVTSDGSIRDLGAEVTPGRSPTSLHYTGLAFDLSTATGMLDPNTDPYIVTAEWPGWHVWARAEGGTDQTLGAVVWQGGRISTQRVSARVIDFTALAVKHGFRDIGFRNTFPGDYASAEWWHFQYEVALVPYISQFGTELLSLGAYSEDRVKAATPLWDSRELIWQRSRDGWVSTPGPAR